MLQQFRYLLLVITEESTGTTDATEEDVVPVAGATRS